MQYEQGSSPSDRLERLALAFDAIRDSADPAVFTREFAAALAQYAGARRSFVVLMRGDTVVAEAAVDGAEGSAAPDDALRKQAARLALAAGRRPAGAGRLHAAEHDGNRLQIAVQVDRGEGLCVILDGPGHGNPASGASADGLLDPLVAMALAHTRRHRQIAEQGRGGGGVGAVAYLKPVAELERDAIELALRQTKWNKEEAARRLGISRASIYMKVKKYNLQRPAEE